MTFFIILFRWSVTDARKEQMRSNSREVTEYTKPVYIYVHPSRMICLSHQKRKVREEENEKKKEKTREKKKKKKNKKTKIFFFYKRNRS